MALTCQNGLDENVAAGRCLQCDHYLCQQCIDIHKKMKITSSHEVVTFAQMKGSKNTQRKHLCSKHSPEELKLYCRDCEEAICRDCTIVDHRMHTYSFLKDISKELAENLQDLSSKVQGRMMECQERLSYMDSVVSANTDNAALCIHQVVRCINEDIRQLELHRDELVRKVETLEKTKAKVVQVSKDPIELNLIKMESAVSFTNQLLESGDNAELALLNSQVKTQLMSLSEYTLPSMDTVDRYRSNWVFDGKQISALEKQVVDLIPSNIRVQPAKDVGMLGVLVITLLEATPLGAAQPVVAITTLEGKHVHIKMRQIGREAKWSVSITDRNLSGQTVHYKVLYCNIQAEGSPGTVIVPDNQFC